jgi:pimeloyl-ACP methyl ester carboxylesterase
MTKVLYFHGFASSPASSKITSLRPLLAAQGIELDTPDLNVPSFAQLDWNAMIELGVRRARETDPAAIAGSSLGSIVALELVRRGIERPLVVIAAAIGIRERWKNNLPDGDPIVVWNHAMNANAPIHRAFFEQMFAINVDERPPSTRVTAIMGTRDETVPFAMVQSTWRRWETAGLAAGSKLIVIDEGDHGLTAHVELIAAEIVRATS